MKIGIIGAGFVGQSLAKALQVTDHQIMLSSRDPSSEKMQTLANDLNVQVGTITETIAFGDIVALAIRWDAVPDVAAVGDWQGKIIMDLTNRFGGNEPESAGKSLTQMIPDGHVVKALNTIGAEHYIQPIFSGERATMFIAGDSDHAKSTVTNLLSEMGFDTFDVGGIDASKHLENLAAFWVYLALQTDTGRDFAFQLRKK